jgi:hypothetical protein
MTDTHHFRTIARSVIYDPFVFRWFEAVIAKELSSPRGVGFTKKERGIFYGYRALRMFMFCMACAMGAVAVLPSYAPLRTIAVITCAVFLLIFMLAHRAFKQLTAKLAVRLTAHCFPDLDLTKTTLYAFSEKIALRYDMLSLVDAIDAIDNAGITFFLAATLLVSFGLLLGTPVWQTLWLILLWLAIPRVVLSQSIFYFRLKPHA